MSLEADQLPAHAADQEEIEQVLLGLADGSYVLGTPDGALAECGAGVLALLGAPPDRLIGRPTAEVLLPGADDAARAAFDQLLLAERADRAAPPTFGIHTPDGVIRSLQLVVVAVPLALGWEFTSLLGELGSRDAGTWRPEALRLRHGPALEAIEGVVRDGRQPDPSARLAGILIVVRDVDAPALTREDVDLRMSEQRAAARAAAAEAAERRDEAARHAAAGPEAAAVEQPPNLEDLVESARVLRERLEETRRELASARAAGEQAQAVTARADAEIDAAREAADAARAELLAARAEAQTARAEREAAQTEAADLRAELEAVRAELERARAAAAAIRAEFAFDPQPGDGADRPPRAVPDASEPAARSGQGPQRDVHGTSASSAEPRPALPPAGPGQAAALISLDGRFKRLDETFCSLLGCREEDLRAARWPSIIDRENLDSHQEIARALRAGEIQSAEIETVYMHAQGLLVPVAGTISLHRAGSAGEPAYFLFRAEVSRTAGAARSSGSAPNG